jgi:hypothetical protein
VGPDLIASIDIRDLRKLTGKAISALPGLTAIKADGQTIGFLTPIRRLAPERLKAVLSEIDTLAAERDPEADTAFLVAEGIDPTDWNAEAVRALQTNRD